MDPIHLTNPVTYKTVNQDPEKGPAGTIDVEETDAGSISFVLMTVAHLNVCEVSGHARLSGQPGKAKIYRFDDGACRLFLTKDDGARTILTSDAGGNCAVLGFCGQSGVIDGYELHRQEK